MPPTTRRVSSAAEIAASFNDAAADGEQVATVDGDGDVVISAHLNEVGGGMTLDADAVNQTAVPAEPGAVFQVGANSGQTASVGINSVKAEDLGQGASLLNAEGTEVAVASIEDISLVAGDGLADAVAGALATIDQAIGDVSSSRAELGAFQNRMESTIRNVSVAVENLSAAESRIRDTDMAQEMVTFTRNQILQQAGTAMLAQANQVPQSVLSLLR